MSTTPALSQFTIDATTRRGRLGRLHLVRDGKALPDLETPALFPVACLVTGTTARGGGIWKYVLQANTERGLMRLDLPLMSQVLHFLDFSVSPQSVEKWRGQPLRQTYNQTLPGLDYQAPLFLDSGGFRLLFTSALDASPYGIPHDDEPGAQASAILRLQKDFGGDIVATLDYPLPPGLAQAEARERMEKSQANAYEAARCLAVEEEFQGFTPLLYVAAHGWDRESIKCYVSQVFARMKSDGLGDMPFGIAVGSLVPLRGSKKYQTIIDIIRGAIEGVPEIHRPNTPVHVFGITGTMIPLLTYLGVDTFDSSTYIQQARSLTYYDPDTHKGYAVLEMDGVRCGCPICTDLDFDDLHRILTQGRGWRPKEGDKYKSEYYAAIALHNLEMDRRIVHKSVEAIRSDSMVEFLVEYADSYPDLAGALQILVSEDEVLRPRLQRSTVAVKKVDSTPISPPFQLEFLPREESTISLRFTPDSFQVPPDYQPPSEKKVLLIIPCSSEKPYAMSRTHAFLQTRLQERFGERASLIHKVTLSGLYGPVPEEFENEEAVLRYDFRLVMQNVSQITLCAQRTSQFLRRYGSLYDSTVAYATSLAYRTVLQESGRRYKNLQLLPERPKQRRLTEFFRNSNVEILLDALAAILDQREGDNGVGIDPTGS